MGAASFPACLWVRSAQSPSSPPHEPPPPLTLIFGLVILTDILARASAINVARLAAPGLHRGPTGWGPSGAFSNPAPTANAAALAAWPDGSEFDVGKRRGRRAVGTRRYLGLAWCRSRLATWLVTRLVNARPATPRTAPRCAQGRPDASNAAAIANHSLEWSAALVRAGMVMSRTDSVSSRLLRRSLHRLCRGPR